MKNAGLDTTLAASLTEAMKKKEERKLSGDDVEEMRSRYFPPTPHESPVIWRVLDISKDMVRKACADFNESALEFVEAIDNSILCTLPLGDFNAKTFAIPGQKTSAIALDPFVLRIVEDLATPVAYAILEILDGNTLENIKNRQPAWLDNIRIILFGLLENNPTTSIHLDSDSSRDLANNLRWSATCFVLGHEYTHVAMHHHDRPAKKNDELEADYYATKCLSLIHRDSSTPWMNFVGIDFLFHSLFLYVSIRKLVEGEKPDFESVIKRIRIDPGKLNTTNPSLETRYALHCLTAQRYYGAESKNIAVVRSVISSVFSEFWVLLEELHRKVKTGELSITPAMKNAYKLMSS